MVYELKPKIAWNKGKAVLWLLQALRLNHRDQVYAIYIGDDTTDEDAFEVFQDRDGPQGKTGTPFISNRILKNL